MGKVIIRTVIGMLAGYVAYLPTILVVEYSIYGRIDSERAFYALYFAVGAPFLLTPSGREFVRLDEVVLSLIGGSLIVLGAIAANTRRARSLTGGWSRSRL
jgi:hypothetical protein